MSEQADLTYGQLRSILEQLGYAIDATRSASDHVTFTHAGPGKAVLLPVFPDRTRVHKIFLTAILGGLKWSLPDDVDRFNRLVREAAERKPRGTPVS